LRPFFGLGNRESGLASEFTLLASGRPS
jgi:hypothetical protein